MMIPTIDQLDVANQRVLMRVDFNVPIADGDIRDDRRIQAALPSIQKLLQGGARLILLSHLGRVKTEEDKEKLSLAPVAKRLAEYLGQPVTFVAETRGAELERAIDQLQPGHVLLMENTRFEDLDGKKESGNDPELAAYWASLGDLFVNDAFGTAHRSHASNVGLASHLPSAIGYLIQEELTYFDRAIQDPDRPFVLILGGAKVSDKIGVIEHLIEQVDYIMIGGGMAYTFIKALGYDVGQSILESQQVTYARDLVDRYGDRLVLPVDTVVTPSLDQADQAQLVGIDAIPDQMIGVDIGPETLKHFGDILQSARTVVWNGPMGVFEEAAFAQGTLGLCKILGGLEAATTIVGGGDSVAAVQALGYEDQFSHLSTGGGASLAYLQGETLPGIAAIAKASSD